MITPDETIERMIRWCPSIIDNRIKALHHLFCVLGNGYVWENGCLVANFDARSGRTPEEFLAPYMLEPYNYLKLLDPQRWEEKQREYADECARLNAISERAHELARTPGDLGREKPYRYCDSLMIAMMPEDVRPDWAAAAREISEYLDSNHPGWSEG